METLGDRLHKWLVEIWDAIAASRTMTGLLFVFESLSAIVKGEGNVVLEEAVTLFENSGILPLAVWGAVFARMLGMQPTKQALDAIRQADDLTSDPPKFVGDLVVDSINNQVAGAIFEPIVKQIMDLVITPLEEDFAAGNVSPMEVISKLGSVVGGLSGSVTIAGFLTELAGAGQIETIQAGAEDVMHTLGIEHGMRELTLPLYRVGFGEFATRYYSKKFRPRRWTAGELMSLYALRQISQGELSEGMSELGYRDADIEHATKLAEHRISAGDILQAHELQVIDLQKMVTLLHEDGYAPDAIDFLVSLAEAKRQQEDYNSIASIALTAYKKGLMSEQQYRQIRAAARIPTERIDLEVQLAALSSKAANLDLKTGNIEAAYKSNTISETEARKYLKDEGMVEAAISVLINTWNEQKAPKVLRLNSTTVLRAYSDGILDTNQAVDHLKALGWKDADAQIMLQIEDAKRKAPIKQPSLGMIQTALANGLIDEAQAVKKLETIGYSADTAALEIQIAKLHPKHGTKTLSDADVVKLYEIGQFTQEQAIKYLVSVGYDEQTANLLLIARTTKVPPKQAAQ